MKLCVIHNRYLNRGGEDECVDLEVQLLRRHGHEVDLILETNERVARLGPLRTALRTVWSAESHTRLRRLFRDGGYDLAVVHNFFPLLSPAVHYAARAEGVPIVQTIHNYRLLCPGAELFRDGHVCEDCLGQAFPWPGVVHGCYRGSRFGTAAVASMLTVHRLLRTWTHKVDALVTLTEFARQKLIDGGVPAEKLRVKPNFVDPDPGLGLHRGRYALYVGRLAPGKGVTTLLDAWRTIRARVPLKIVGDGPLADQVRRAAADGGVEWLGRRPIPEVLDLMGDASVVIAPSELYETFGRVVIEAFAKGTPVIASGGGAMAELIAHGQNGLHFDHADGVDLAREVWWAWEHPDEIAEMGRNARREYELKYTADRNYQRMQEIYAFARGERLSKKASSD